MRLVDGCLPVTAVEKAGQCPMHADQEPNAQQLSARSSSVWNSPAQEAQARNNTRVPHACGYLQWQCIWIWLQSN